MIKLTPSVDKLLEYMACDYNAVKLKNFYSQILFDEIRLRPLYQPPVYSDGLLVNSEEDKGPYIGEGASYLTSSFNTKDYSVLFNNSVTDPNKLDKERIIYAYLVCNKDSSIVGDYQETMVLELKRPYKVTPEDSFGFFHNFLYTFENEKYFKITSYNELLGKEERIYGWLMTDVKIIGVQVACGRLTNISNIVTPQQELAYIKDRAENIQAGSPLLGFNPGNRTYNLRYDLESKLSYTDNRKVYQLNGTMTVPETPPEPPTIIVAKPYTPQGFDKNLMWVFVKFDGFARGSTINLSLSLGLS